MTNLPPDQPAPPILSAGGVVCCTDAAGEVLVLLIQDKQGVWTLPKGRLETGESEATAAQREVGEETGIVCAIGPLVQRVQYPIYKNGAWRDKTVAYFLACAAYAAPTPCAAEGIGAAQWVAPAAALPLIGYAQVREVVRRALDLLKSTQLAPP